MNIKKTILVIMLFSLLAVPIMAAKPGPSMNPPIDLAISPNTWNDNGDVTLDFCMADEDFAKVKSFSVIFDLVVEYTNKQSGDLVAVNTGFKVDKADVGIPEECDYAIDDGDPNDGSKVTITITKEELQDELVWIGANCLGADFVCGNGSNGLASVVVKGGDPCQGLSTIKVKLMDPPGEGYLKSQDTIKAEINVDEDKTYDDTGNLDDIIDSFCEE